MNASLTTGGFARLVFTGLFFLLFAGLPGCGSGRQKSIYVGGQITYGGGPWPKGGTIYFNPVKPAPGFNARSGTGDFGPDGAFVVKSFEDSPGLAPGTYSVNIECWEVPPSMEGKTPPKSFVPAEFQPGGKSAFSLEVKPDDSPHNLKYDIPKK